ncbi:hypothetical protein ACWPKO_24780 (plasmid) [Coraliomargarita sp. W4R53]
MPIASFTFPAIAALLLVGWVVGRVDDAPILISGVLAAIAAALAGWGLVQDRRDPMATDLTVGRMLGFLHLIPSVIASAIALVALSRGAADGGLGLIGLLADLVVGVLYFVAHRGPARHDTHRWRRNFARLESVLDTIPADERARVYSDMQHAFVVLGQRGLVEEDQLARARGLRIGTLGMTMAPREDLIRDS